MLGTEGMLTEGQPAPNGKLQLEVDVDDEEDEADDVVPAPDVDEEEVGEDPCEAGGFAPLKEGYSGLPGHLGLNCCNDKLIMMLRTFQISPTLEGNGPSPYETLGDVNIDFFWHFHFRTAIDAKGKNVKGS